MNALSGRFRLVVLGVIVIVAVVSCCTFPSITDTTPFFGVEIGHPLGGGARKYVPWKSQGQFDSALKQVCDHHHGTYCLKVKLDDKSKPIPYGSKDCTDCCRENIRTVKVRKSKAADNIAAGESAANDPNVMHRVQSPDPGDIITVLNALK
jgi:hypothetical protein